MMSVPPRLIYFHGFASSPSATKAVRFREAFRRRGWNLEVPDLNTPDFRDLTVGYMLRRAEETIEQKPDAAVLIGSSLGGYLAAMLSGRLRCVQATILMAPAFMLRERWERRVGPELLAVWKRMGAIPIQDHPFQSECSLGFQFYEESIGYPAYPEAGEIPILVFQGTRDDMVPPEVVAAWAKGKENVRVHYLDDDHSLLESVPVIVEESQRFLETHFDLGSKVHGD